MWNASHLAARLCALRHWKRVSMPPTTQSHRHPLTRAHHFAPRIKTARRYGEKKPDDKMIDIQYSITIIGGREVSKALKKSKRGIFEPLETANCG